MPDQPATDEPTWSCIVCERTFSANQPRFVDYEADEPTPVELCIDCSY